MKYQLFFVTLFALFTSCTTMHTSKVSILPLSENEFCTCCSQLQYSGMQSIVDAFNQAFENAYLNGDSQTIANMSTPDVIISPIDHADLRGRNDIQAILSQVFAHTTVLEYSLIPVEMESVHDRIYERGIFRWVAVSQEDTLTTDGRYSAVRKRTSEGEWQLHRLIENELPITQISTQIK